MKKDSVRKIIAEKEEASQLITAAQLEKCSKIIASAMSTDSMTVIPSETQISMVMALGKVFDEDISNTLAKYMVNKTMGTLFGNNNMAGLLISSLDVHYVLSPIANNMTKALGWSCTVDFAKRHNNMQ